MSPVTPTSLGCQDQIPETLPVFSDIFDLEEMSVDKPIPILPAIFELEESCAGESVRMNCVSGVSISAFSIVAHPSSVTTAYNSHDLGV